jgi:resuscitation-promoting factor RpfB
MNPYFDDVELLPSDYRKIAVCESSLDPTAVNRTGKYRGLFQFDNRSWKWVGGSGDPSRASVREQLNRAQELVKRQGFARAFPQCSKKMGVK